jgi:two-component system chemotaxis response regulator CheY
MKPTKILVADPSAYMAGLTVGMLRSIGAQSVVSVNDSAAALLALARQKFDLLVIDDVLEPMDGVELTRQIRKTEGGMSQMPVIMVFAEADRQRIVDARDAGVTEFIKKPLSARLLEIRIAQAMDNPRPFITVPSYAGPDRRRRGQELKGTDRRQAAAEEGKADVPDSESAA